jgi:hypothetical protein
VVLLVRVRVLDSIVLVAVHRAIVRVVLMVVIVVGVIVEVRVLDAVGMRVDVLMRWLGCVLAAGHKNLGTAESVRSVAGFLDDAIGRRCSGLPKASHRAGGRIRISGTGSTRPWVPS